MTTDSTVIGFIGLGSMGWPMAECLQRARYPLTVIDIDQERAKSFAQKFGGEVASDCKALAAAANVVITMLPTSTIVEEVLNGSNGVFAGMRSGTVIIEMSSGDPAHTLRLSKQASDSGGMLVDAPVSGGVSRAKTGELAIMFGGPQDAFDRVQPILQIMGNSLTRTGDVGSAHAMKALNNLVSAGGFLIAVEALLIGKQFGLNPEVIVDVLNASTGMNNSTQKKLKQFVLSRQFNSGFGMDLMVKDLTIALHVADEIQAPVPFARLCRELWASAAKTLGEGQDHTAIARFSEQLAGIRLG